MLVLCCSAAFSHLRYGHFLKLLGYWFCSCVTLFKVFLCFLLPMARDIHHSVWMLQHVNFAFNFNVQHAMEVLFRLINICWSFHCFCLVADLQFFPIPRCYIIFLDESNFCCLLYFSLFNVFLYYGQFSYLEYCETSCPLVLCLPFAAHYRSQVKC